MDFLMSMLSTIFKVDEHLNNWNRNSEKSDAVVFEGDIEYTEGELLDILYTPEANKPYPVVINIHGGGWLVGDKKWRKGIATMYAENGFFVINPNYSLSPAKVYPDCIRDIFKVLDFIDKNKEKYNLDIDRIYMTGDSAGAHLTAVVGAVQNNREVLERMNIDEPKLKIAKLALFCGVYDFDKCVGQPGAQGLVKEMTGYDFKTYKDEFPFYKELSPLSHVDASFPPTYMVSAPFDIFCDGQAELLDAKLTECNVRHIHYIPEDKYATHCFHLNLRRKDSLEAIGGAIDFLKENDKMEK